MTQIFFPNPPVGNKLVIPDSASQKATVVAGPAPESLKSKSIPYRYLLPIYVATYLDPYYPKSLSSLTLVRRMFSCGEIKGTLRDLSVC